MSLHNALKVTKVLDEETQKNYHTYQARVSEAWTIGGIPQGGYVVGLVLSAAGQLQSQTLHPDPIHVTAHYLQPVDTSECFIRIKVLRIGKKLSNLEADLIQDGKTKIATRLVYGVLPDLSVTPSSDFLTLTPPSPYARRIPFSRHPSLINPTRPNPKAPYELLALDRSFEERNTVRAARRSSQSIPDVFHPHSETSSNEKEGPDCGLEWGAWFELKDSSDVLENAMIPFFADCMRNLPSLLPREQRPGPSWFATVVLTVEFKSKIPASISNPNTTNAPYSPRTVGVYSSAHFMSEGRHDASVEIWTSPSLIGGGSLDESSKRAENMGTEWRERQICLAISTQMALTIPEERSRRSHMSILVFHFRQQLRHMHVFDFATTILYSISPHASHHEELVHNELLPLSKDLEIVALLFTLWNALKLAKWALTAEKFKPTGLGLVQAMWLAIVIICLKLALFPFSPSTSTTMSCGLQIPRKAYRGLACLCCGEASPSLLRCSRCKRVSYCDDACQKDDYDIHKYFCRAWTSLREREPPVLKIKKEEPTLRRDFAGKRIMWTLIELASIFGRPLNCDETKLVVMEPRCSICFRTDYDLRQDPMFRGQTLTTCEECFSVFACSDAHGEILAKTHNFEPFEAGSRMKRCDLHVLVVMDDKEEGCESGCLHAHAHGQSSEPIWFIKFRRMKYKPLPIMEDLSDTRAWVKWLLSLDSPWPSNLSDYLRLRDTSRSFSLPLTVLYGFEQFENAQSRELLDKCPGPSSLSTAQQPFHLRTHLEIHIVNFGLNEVTLEQSCVFEQLQHLLPECIHLTVRFIGPDFSDLPDTDLDVDKLVNICSDCKTSGVSRTESIHPYCYNEWIQDRLAGNVYQSRKSELPDLVICPNACMTESQTNAELWAPTVSMLLDIGVPTFVSALTDRHAKSDKNFVSERGGLMVIEPHRNPWRSERGFPDSTGNDEFYFMHNYVFGFCGRA